MSENASREMPTPIPIKLVENTAREPMARAAIDFPRTIARVWAGAHRPHRRRRLTLTIPTRSASVGRAASTAPKI